MSTATKTHRVTDFDVVRDMPLPAGTILEQVRAVKAFYRKFASNGMDHRDATEACIELLDQILADRDPANPYEPEPIPAVYAPLATYLRGESYPPDWVRVILRQVERTGTAIGCDSIEEEHQMAAQAILDRLFPWPSDLEARS